MVSNHTWTQDFTVTDEDMEYLNTLLLEREVPLDVQTLATELINARVQQENEKLQNQFKDAVLYDPAADYMVGQRLVFSTMDYAIGQVVDKRPGENGAYGEFSVISVKFDNAKLNTNNAPRQFAVTFPQDHILNTNNNGDGIPMVGELDPADVLEADFFDDIIDRVDERLKEDTSLIRVAGYWFAKELMIQTNEGHMHLAEAILDMFSGGPLTTQEIIEQIGGIGSEPIPLQIFSLNYALNEDSRFDEVGPAGEVLWFLRRMEPKQVQETPVMLRYTPIPYDHDTLPDEALSLEADLLDEHSPLPLAPARNPEAKVIITYPHRRCGTLPLNAQASRIFPTARQTERVSVVLIDAADNEEYPAWVVRSGKYVHGLNPLYKKHALPIGSTVRLRRGDTPGHIIIDFQAHKPRSEYVTIVTANDGHIGFETAKRAIGADFDPLLLLGVDDLEGVDKLFQARTSAQQPLATILRMIIPMLGKLNTQGHVHAKTLYSALNVIRRCPPGPILATLINNPDFENVGGHYWKLS